MGGILFGDILRLGGEIFPLDVAVDHADLTRPLNFTGFDARLSLGHGMIICVSGAECNLGGKAKSQGVKSLALAARPGKYTAGRGNY